VSQEEGHKGKPGDLTPMPSRPLFVRPSGRHAAVELAAHSVDAIETSRSGKNPRPCGPARPPGQGRADHLFLNDLEQQRPLRWEWPTHRVQRPSITHHDATGVKAASHNTSPNGRQL